MDGGTESVEALTRDSFGWLAWRWRGEDFLKYRGVQNKRVGAGGVRVALRFFAEFQDFLNGVAGVAEDGVASGLGEERADFGCGVGRTFGGEVDAVGSSCKRDGGGAVEEDLCGLVDLADNGDDGLG